MCLHGTPWIHFIRVKVGIESIFRNLQCCIPKVNQVRMKTVERTHLLNCITTIYEYLPKLTHVRSARHIHSHPNDSNGFLFGVGEMFVQVRAFIGLKSAHVQRQINAAHTEVVAFGYGTSKKLRLLRGKQVRTIK